MRLQPPKKKIFEGKKATEERVLSYIGSHRIVFYNGEEETTVDEYMEEHFKNFTLKDIEDFLTMFPCELLGMAELYMYCLLSKLPGLLEVKDWVLGIGPIRSAVKCCKCEKGAAWVPNEPNLPHYCEDHAPWRD